MHKRHLLSLGLALALSAAVLVPRPADASDYQAGYTFGIGGVIGQPTGVSMEFLLGGGHAIQAVFGFDLWYRDGFTTFANWQWHPLIITSISAFDLSFHFGAGLFLSFWYDHHYDFLCDWDPRAHRYYNCHDEDVGLGALVPVGLDMFFTGAPVEVYLELSPGFWFVPFIDFWMLGGVGARYYF
jgi:hypothetical protein